MILHTLGDHYDEETLIRVAEASGEIDDPHLHDCDDCRMAVDQYREMLSCVDDESVWDHRPIDDTPNPQTIATLRAFVEEMHREDAEAEPLVAELLAGSREEWMPRLMADEKYRTAGVVRKLIGMMDEVSRRSAADYAVVASLAVEVAERVESDSDTVRCQLRGSAWRELAFARYLAGEIDSSSEAEARARVAFGTSTTSLEIARLDMLLALIESRCAMPDRALTRVESSASTFAEFGERKREADALWLQSNVLSEKRAYRNAISVSADLRRTFDDVLDDHAKGSLLLNEGHYLREIGEYGPALACLQEARFIFDAIGARTPAARVTFSVALVLQATGRLDPAAERLTEAVRELREVGLEGAATLAILHLAEVRLEQQRFDEVERFCREAVEQVKSSAVAYRERALTALGLLREVAERRRASPELIRHVRSYVERLPKEPTLLFLPPPIPLDYRD